MSHPPRFFIDPSLITGTKLLVTGDDLRHIRTVLRKGPGDLLTLLDGKGMEYEARIVESGRDAVICEVVTQKKNELSGPRITLGQGIAKSDKMDWIVQKTTELGVAAIVPLVTEHTIVKVKDEAKRISRWQKISREAAMQSRRFDIPVIGEIMNYSEFIGRTPLYPPLARGEQEGGRFDAASGRTRSLFLIPWEEGTRSIRDILRSHPEAADITVLIGPEGGFSSAEAKAAQEKGFHAVSLGRNILRSETAAVAALSMIMYEYEA